MKVLNLYAGLGGNRKHWKGCEVTSVELNPQIAEVYKQLYPRDTLVVGDAHQYLLDHYKEFDFIWSSPPCQTHSKMIGGHEVKRFPDMSLYQEILFLEHHFKGLWVVENVIPYYEALIQPKRLVGRHAFWCNFQFQAKEEPSPEGFIVLSDTRGKEKLQEWLGIKYEGNIYYGDNHCLAQILRNCVHPNVGAQIMSCAVMSTI